MQHALHQGLVKDAGLGDRRIDAHATGGLVERQQHGSVAKAELHAIALTLIFRIDLGDHRHQLLAAHPFELRPACLRLAAIRLFDGLGMKYWRDKRERNAKQPG